MSVRQGSDSVSEAQSYTEGDCACTAPHTRSQCAENAPRRGPTPWSNASPPTLPQGHKSDPAARAYCGVPLFAFICIGSVSQAPGSLLRAPRLLVAGPLFIVGSGGGYTVIQVGA
eukprot:scaffold1194_cov369-Prasinococcus_capsulatus_cf.AAC.15